MLVVLRLQYTYNIMMVHNSTIAQITAQQWLITVADKEVLEEICGCKYGMGM
jgi:hypothetical protein